MFNYFNIYIYYKMSITRKYRKPKGSKSRRSKSHRSKPTKCKPRRTKRRGSRRVKKGGG